MKLLIFIFLFNQAFCQIKTNYIIKDVDSLTGEMYVSAKQISTKTCRKNVANTKVILKFEGEIPDIFKNDIIYNHQLIMQEIAKDEWSGYSGGLKVVGSFLVTDYLYKNLLKIKINDWMYINPIEIKDGLWIVPYVLYSKYQQKIDANISSDKYVIRNVRKREFIDLN